MNKDRYRPQVLGQDVRQALEDLSPTLREHFDAQRARQEELQIDINDTSERVRFGHVILEVNSEPESALVLKASDGLVPFYGPRLELHLLEGGGLQDTRTQLGRIARYIVARNLQDEFPLLSTSTWPRLAALTRRIIPGAICPLATYVYAQRISNGILGSLDDFEKDNGRITQSVTIDSMVMRTDHFTRDWSDRS